MNAAVLAFLFLLIIPKNMAMATAINPKSQGVKIALAKAQRAQEMMQAFRRASVNQKVK